MQIDNEMIILLSFLVAFSVFSPYFDFDTGDVVVAHLGRVWCQPTYVCCSYLKVLYSSSEAMLTAIGGGAQPEHVRSSHRQWLVSGWAYGSTHA